MSKRLFLCGVSAALAMVFGCAAAPIDSVLSATFDSLLAHAQRELMSSSAPLGACASADAPGPCRAAFQDEPPHAVEVLPFLVNDASTVNAWKANFVRHAKALDSAPAEAFAPEVVERLGRSLFWESRPVASQGALNHLQHKMQQRRAQGTPVTWEAALPDRFSGMSVKESKVLMGAILASRMRSSKTLYGLSEELRGGVSMEQLEQILPDYATAKAGLRRADQESRTVVPEAFDAREAFAFCRDVIGHVRDQGSCGSCWAMASTEALNDRICVASKGSMKALLSTQHTTSCCNAIHCLSFGCNGGIPQYAWKWFTANGVVTGGDYSDASGDSCWPYEIPNCAHHSEAPYPGCEAGHLKTPKCRKECLDPKYGKEFSQDVHRAVSAYAVRGRDNIKQALVQGGSLTAAFMVYEDFVMYKGGVYEHVTGGELGGHAVKLIGYGSQEAKDYWLLVNSWNEYWGEKGLFKIAMGECDIDSDVVGGDVGHQAQHDGVSLEL